MNLFSQTNWQIRLYIGLFLKCFNNLYHASGHTFYAHIRTSRWLNITNMGVFSFVVHMACNYMDATYLSDNEWTIYLYAMVSNDCFLLSSIRREIVWMPLAWVVMYGSICLYATVSVSCESMTVQPSV